MGQNLRVQFKLHQDSSPHKLIVSGQENNYRVEHMKRVISGQWIYTENSFDYHLREDRWFSMADHPILKVQFCNSLRSLSLSDRFCNLKSLTVWSCPELMTLGGLNSLPILRNLVIWDCPALEFVPGEQIPPTLRHLILYGCESLKTLSVLELREIWMLNIGNCCNLSSVVGVQNLTSLTKLWIMQCPELQIPPDELLPPKPSLTLNARPSKSFAAHFQDCPGLKQWCQRNEISYFEVVNTTMRTESEEGNENYALDNYGN